MRRKTEAVLRFEWDNDDLPKTVREYREKYQVVNRILGQEKGTGAYIGEFG